MAHIPFIGRLHSYEYLALGLSFLLALIELFVRTITLLLPTPIIRFCYRVSRKAFNALSSPYSRRARNKKKAVSSPIAQANDFTELCELFGYATEEHVVQTKDGYLLGLHRLGWRRGEEDVRVNTGPGSVAKKVVYLHHGLLMNSEVWVCITEKERCLPFLLVDQGYDVWLGNNRGNKYSKKCMHCPPTAPEFWDFSMDQFAFHDIPDSINYILSTTAQPSLSYIGFSQGTAQAFATLSIHPTLNNKVDVFVALAPAMAPPGLASGIVSSLVKTNPEVLFLLFGRRAILGSTTMWSALLYPALFAWFIDRSLHFLFGWRTRNISPHQKLAAYPHLYSFTSTKSVVHWFQIIRNGVFQMYDDEVSTPLSLSQGSRYYKVAKFPTRNIRTPIVLVYGGSDSLVDVKVMLRELPRHTVARCIPKYEHLDLLWAADVDRLVFPHVLEALEWYALPEATKAGERGSLQSPFGGSAPPEYDGNGIGVRGTPTDDEGTLGSSVATIEELLPPRGRREIVEHQMQEEEEAEHMDESDYDDDSDNGEPEHLALTPQPVIPATMPKAHQTRSLPAALEGAGLQSTTAAAIPTPALPTPLTSHNRPPSLRSSSQNTATSQITVVPAAVAASRTAFETSPPQPQPPSQRRIVSPSARNRRERHRRSRVSEDGEGVVTILSSGSGGVGSATDDVEGESSSVLVQGGSGAGSRRVRPEGWWSTDTSSMEFEPGTGEGSVGG